jgi:hypothetical protein
MSEVLSGKAAEYRREAVEHAESLRSVFAELSGLSAREAAEELNRRGITTAWGYKWHASQVRLVRRRLGGALIATGDIQQTMRRAADAPVRTSTSDPEQGLSDRRLNEYADWYQDQAYRHYSPAALAAGELEAELRTILRREVGPECLEVEFARVMRIVRRA